MGVGRVLVAFSMFAICEYPRACIIALVMVCICVYVYVQIQIFDRRLLSMCMLIGMCVFVCVSVCVCV